MAQFTTHGRLKLLFNGEGVLVSPLMEHNNKDPFHFKCRSVLTHKRRTRYMASSARMRIHYASSCSSSLRSKANRCNAEARHTSGNEGVRDEYEYDSDEDEDGDEDDDDDVFQGDGLSCFRGLVLDISYRSFLSFNVLFLFLRVNHQFSTLNCILNLKKKVLGIVEYY